jgi:ribosomal protein S12 methylthiotransferase accessory factor YcaO
MSDLSQAAKDLENRIAALKNELSVIVQDLKSAEQDFKDVSVGEDADYIGVPSVSGPPTVKLISVSPLGSGSTESDDKLSNLMEKAEKAIESFFGEGM